MKKATKRWSASNRPEKKAPAAGDPIHTVVDVAVILDVHPKTVRRWIASGRLAVCRLGHRTTRIRQSDLDAFLEESSR